MLSVLFSHKPIAACIMSYLPIIHQMWFKRMFRLCDINIYERFWKICCKVLNYRGFDGELIMSVLDEFEKEDYVSLSGGFVLHCLTCTDDNLYFDGDDIDFFTRDDTPECFEKIAKDFCKKYPITRSLYIPTIHKQFYEYDHLGYKMISAHGDDFSCFMIQNSYVGSSKDFVDGFDFDFCKNVITQKRLTVKNPFCVLDKCCILLECNIQKVFIRQTTYNFQYDNHPLDSPFRMDIRIEKYRKRGFNFILVKEENQYMSSDIISEMWKKWKNKTFFC